MAKVKAKRITYIAKRALTNDKTGKYFKVGDTVTGSDFPAAVIKHWVNTGVLKEVR